MGLVAGVDLGGTAINYTLVDQQERFLIEGLCEHPALAKQGPEVCLQQIADALQMGTEKAGVPLSVVFAFGLDTPVPARASARLSARGSPTSFHPKWPGFDFPESVSRK